MRFHYDQSSIGRADATEASPVTTLKIFFGLNPHFAEVAITTLTACHIFIIKVEVTQSSSPK